MQPSPPGSSIHFMIQANTNTPSARAQILTRRTYNRPKDDGTFETWPETVNRVLLHQQWLWERAQGRGLEEHQLAELAELGDLMRARKVSMSGRTLWLGGTEVAQRREASQFNCSFTHAETVYDMVDILWLLLQGCGVGFKPIVGTLTGFLRPIPSIEVVRSTRTEKGGYENNYEAWDPATKTWTISIGDSAEAWAKSIGKLLAGKHPADKLVLDFSQIRPAGGRLKGYGWISSGDADLARAYEAIVKILNLRAGSMLSRIDILDIVNWMGTVLSSRRSAEICVVDYGDEEWEEFATAKKEFWLTGNHHRQMSNNTLLFTAKPTRAELARIFDMMIAAGGSEPGFANAVQALKRAPWFKGFNPCAEILLGNKLFCNLVEIDVAKFRGDSHGLRRAVFIVARANYRQTCVNLKDGILQEAWHLNNQHYRLCGVGLTGVVRRPDLRAYDYKELQRTATSAAMGMADELGMETPKNVTTIKPSGTLGKVMDTTEGAHKPPGRHIFNNVTFKKSDELVPALRAANYRVKDKPFEMDSVLVTLPMSYPDVPFEDFNGVPVNLEPAVAQLERYKMLMENWCQQNVSQTIYYGPEEKDAIVDWLYQNWDSYVGVSFIFRTDPTKTAKDLGYEYLPQEVVTRETYEAYVSTLKPLDFSAVDGHQESLDQSECAGGACPVR